MNILILNPILFTHNNYVIPKVKTIKDTMIYGFCLGFMNLGHHVTLIAAEDFTPTENEEYDFEVIFMETKFKKLFKPAILPYFSKLSQYIKGNHEKFDLVISSEVFSMTSLIAANICPNKLIIWQELIYHQNKFHQIPSKIWYNLIAKLFMHKTFKVVPRSKRAYNFVKEYMPQTTDIIVDHGININKFKYSSSKQRQLISSSRLNAVKNVDQIIYSFHALHAIEGYKDIKLLIAGRGDEEIKLKQLVKDLDLENYVTFLGFLSQNELNEYVRNSLGFLIKTSRDLNLVSIPESIVSGTPLLTNMVPSSAEYILSNELGIAKNNWDEKDIIQLIENNTTYTRNCIKYREKLTNTYCANLMIKIFNSSK